MAKSDSPYTCDVCGIAKGEVNHWWIAWVDILGQLVLRQWDDKIAACTTQGIKHICGAVCLDKVVDAYRNEITAKIQEERK